MLSRSPALRGNAYAHKIRHCNMRTCMGSHTERGSEESIEQQELKVTYVSDRFLQQSN